MAKGTIARLIKDRGYGFIATEDGKDVFFHQTGLQGLPGPGSLPYLELRCGVRG
ncbi:unnamed protein product, partial [marine sediment metagenome]